MVRTALVIIAAVGLISSSAFAAGSSAKGRELFNNPKFAGNKTGNSCNTCHPNGSGLENAGSKKEFHIMGGTQHSLEEAVIACIKGALNGKPIKTGSAEMSDITAYIRSLGLNKRQ